MKQGKEVKQDLNLKGKAANPPRSESQGRRQRGRLKKCLTNK